MSYSASHWRNHAAPIIARILAEHPDDKRAQRKALHDAYPFGERAHHPYKIWLDEIARQTQRRPKLGARVNRFGKMVAPQPPDPRQADMFAEKTDDKETPTDGMATDSDRTRGPVRGHQN